MSDPIDPTLSALSKHVQEYISAFQARQSWHYSFAFWHDVGVTGLGATSTALLGLTEISRIPKYQNAVRGLVLFITAAITVFVACDHFFRFKAREQAYRSALVQLLSIERKIGLLVNPTVADVAGLAADFEAAVIKVDPEPVGSIWFSRRARWLAVAFILLLIGIIWAFIYYAVFRVPPTV